jgi:protein-L-isoaspartate(D-aspartate) O-methyltransferase
MNRIQAARRFYADMITAKAGAKDDRIRDAFARVPREDFLGPGPWLAFVFESGEYVATPSDDPVLVYQDILFGLSVEQGINNGSPALHARSLGTVAPKIGDHVLQVGVGTGYYTAILSDLVGSSGEVTAMEIDSALAEQAGDNLGDRANVAVQCRSGAEAPLPDSDVIYVSAGATHPMPAWLDALRPGGRLIFPLTPESGMGGMLLITRSDGGYAARFVSPAAFIPMIGGQDEATAVGLVEAFERGGWQNVQSLVADGRKPDESCWVAGNGWWLSTRAV